MHCQGQKAEESHRRHEGLEYSVLDALCELRDGAIVERRELGVFEIRAGQIEPACSANFVLAVNVINVPSRRLQYPRVGEIDQLAARAERKGLIGTNVNAGGTLIFLGQSIETKGALDHPWGQNIVVFVGRHLEGAGNHAVTTSHAFPGIVRNGANFRFCKGAYNACGNAGRLIAVHALNFQITLLVGKLGVIESIYHGVSAVSRPAMAIENGFVIEGLNFLRGQFISLIAGPFAFSAPNTNRGIDQNAK